MNGLNLMGRRVEDWKIDRVYPCNMEESMVNGQKKWVFSFPFEYTLEGFVNK
jgi:hypothetical protein